MFFMLSIIKWRSKNKEDLIYKRVASLNAYFVLFINVFITFLASFSENFYIFLYYFGF
jgi:hypothetical protein